MKILKNLSCASFIAAAAQTPVVAAVPVQPPLVLHAARLLDVASGRLTSPAEILVEGERITAAGGSVPHPAGARLVDLGDVTLMPGLIDVHVHLFLHPGVDEDMQTVKESVPTRTLLAAIAARDDLMAGYTAERDMGTEGAGSADSAVRDAINAGLLPGPRLHVSGNAVSILGGHEDAIRFNPDIHMPSNASYANDTAELTTVIRQQHKEGADFVKIYETGHDEMRNGTLHTP
jgi:imidazolonepropionase-like amidohydrolase